MYDPHTPATRSRPSGRQRHPVAGSVGKPRCCWTVHTVAVAGRGAVYRVTALAGALLLVTLVVLDAARLGGVGGQLTKQPICAAYGVSADGGSTVRGPTMPDKRPARWTVDLFRPTRVRPTTITITVIRHGRRLGLIDAELLQEGQPVARSRALFAGPSETPEGQVRLPDRTFQAPPPDLLPHRDEQRLYY